MERLRELLVLELRDLYSAEKQLVAALPKMARAASSMELKEAFEKHLGQTEEHVSRLEQVFEALGLSARAKKCEAMAGLIDEGSQFIKDKESDQAVRDAALIGAAQKVEHYEIASYGTVRTWAQLLGEKSAAKLLQQTLDEEAATDETLTGIAEQINLQAEVGSGA